MTRRLAACLVVIGTLCAGCAAPAPAPPPAPGTAPAPAAAPPPAPGTAPAPVPAPPPAPVAAPAPTPSPSPAPPPPAPPRGAIEPTEVQQGDIAVLRLDKPVTGDVTVRVEGLDEQPKAFVRDGLAVAFLGFPAAARVGSYPVTVTWADGEWKGAVAVLYKKFTEDRLVVTEKQEQTYFDPGSSAEWARVFKLRSTSLPRPLWDGAFQVPVKGKLEITTYFGEIRFVNGKETGRHSGMDFAADTGTPVYVPARGKVILAERLILTGNTVMIDHGDNLFTAFYHLSAMSVTPGQLVTPGQELGKVGNTGFSTGPHLHWTATIGNTPVDPWPLTLAAPLGVSAIPPLQ